MVTRIIVKFALSAPIPYNASAADAVDVETHGGWTALLQSFPGLQLEPLFRPPAALGGASIGKLIDKARARDPEYDHLANTRRLDKFFQVVVPAGVSPDAVVADLSALSVVERAYVAPRERRERLSAPPQDYTREQTYLKPGTDGIDAQYAWTQGSLGDRVIFADLEGGWKEDHADLQGPAAIQVWGYNEEADKRHGTSVLGIVYAQHGNGYVSGIAPNLAGIHLVSRWAAQGAPDLYGGLAALLALAEGGSLRYGDVVLTEIELEMWDYDPTVAGDRIVPLETDDAAWLAIRTLTAYGVAVVESAGNGTARLSNLDTYQDYANRRILNPNAGPQEYFDSLAIVVAAAEQVSREYGRASGGSWISNYGALVNCFAQGSGVYSLDYSPTEPHDSWTSGFSGTSAAAAIIAGVACVVQGAGWAKNGVPYGPSTLRRLLSDPNTGTRPGSDTLTGVMPDLNRILPVLP